RPPPILGCLWPSGILSFLSVVPIQHNRDQRAVLDTRASVRSGPLTLPDMRPIVWCVDTPAGAAAGLAAGQNRKHNEKPADLPVDVDCVLPARGQIIR